MTVIKTDAGEMHTYYPLHPCSDEEFGKFTPDPDAYEANKVVERHRANKNLFCLHPTVLDYYLHGSYISGTDYTAIDVQLVSCASHYVLFDGTELAANDDCVLDKQEVQAHLGFGIDL